METINTVTSLAENLSSEYKIQAATVRDTQPKSATFLGQNLIFRDNHTSPSPPAMLPKGKIFNLIPRLIVSNKQLSLQSRNREPRFVPFEPYKAAVNPIVPQRKHQNLRINKKNNLDLNTLVSHMSSMKMTSMLNLEQQDPLKMNELEQQRIKYEKQLADLRKDRDCVSAQLKSQVQVNTELKNLLVAAVGEDLQTRVNVLTEDKLQLARALLSTAQNLSSHTVCLCVLLCDRTTIILICIIGRNKSNIWPVKVRSGEASF